LDVELVELVCDVAQWERGLDILGSGAALADFELALRHSSGDEVSFLVNAALRRLGTGEHLLEASLLDVTARRRHEQERSELHEHLFRVQRTETVGALAGGIAHDFNNLLTIILNCASTLGERVAHRPELAGSVGSIRDAATRAASLTTQLLNFARGGGARTTKLQVNDSVRDVVGLLSETIRRGIAIGLTLDEALPDIVGNRDEVHQCVLNLALNACEAMGAQGRLTITTRRGVWPQPGDDQHARAKAGEYIEVAVADTGPGMSPEVQARIFEPFFTTKRRAGATGVGLGLGLAMVQRIIERHDGSVFVRSVAGQGTRVSLLLPIPAARRAPPPAPAPTRVVEPESSLIILADDEPAIRRVGKRILERERFTVLTAENGEDAVARVRENPEVMLVILDLVMPVMSGEEAYAKIREFNEEARFLLCTGHAVTRSLHNILRDARVRLLHKPYSIAEFTDAVRGVLEDSGGRG
ncbi:MAG: response regulator, partial [Myxococcales bacterium]|nr:response regulator [Myxococcales bacterium]